jgi:Domain of unknown function (DUF1707)/Domain of unknown function (DUF4190)
VTTGPGYGYPSFDPGRMLASTADRERALDVLKAGFAEGRLNKEEYDDRVGSTYAARTYADLGELTGDLPGGQPPPVPYQPLTRPFGTMPFPPAQHPPAVYPPAQYPPAQYPPAQHPPAQHPPAVYPPAQYPVAEQPEPKPNALAVASMWCAIGGLVFGLPGIAAIILGHMAFGQIRRTGEEGSGTAAVSIVLGWVGIILFVLRIAVTVNAIH